MNDEFIDVTNENDVSEQIMDHDSMVHESEIPVYHEIPDNALVFHSMDGRHYLINKDLIDWDQTADNLSCLENNMTVVRQALMSMFLDKTHADTSYANTEIKDMIINFGCTPKYDVTFPDADDYDKAQMYCIDALELMNIIILEVKNYLVNKSFMDCLNNITEVPHGNYVQEDSTADT